MTSRIALLAAVLASGAVACGVPVAMDLDGSSDTGHETSTTDTVVDDTHADLDSATDADAASPDADLDAGTDAMIDTGTDAGTDAHDAAVDAAPVTVNFQNGVSPTSSYAGTTDTYIGQSTATTNHGTDITLWCDGDYPVGMNQTKASLIRWDVQQIPVGSRVMSASITVALSNVTNAGTTDRFSIYESLRGWSESEATWRDAMSGVPWAAAGASQLGSDRAVAEVGGVSALASGSQTVRLNAAGVTLVQHWVDDPDTNYGVQISNWISDNGMGLASSEFTTAASRPKLSVVYVPR